MAGRLDTACDSMVYSTISGQSKKVLGKLPSQREVNEGELIISPEKADESRINAMEEPGKLHSEGESDYENVCSKKAHNSSSFRWCEELMENVQSVGNEIVCEAERGDLQTEIQESVVHDFDSTYVQAEPCFTYSRKKLNRIRLSKKQEAYGNHANQKTLISIPFQQDSKEQSKEDDRGLKRTHLVKSDEVHSGSRKKYCVTKDSETEITDLLPHRLHEVNLETSNGNFSGSTERMHEIVADIKPTDVCEPVGALTQVSEEQNLVKSNDVFHGSRKRIHVMGLGTMDTGLFDPVEVIEDANYAALASGLPPHSVSIAERIQFGNILKQADGFEKYLKHRNIILDQWQRDIHHTLSVTDSGISGAASSDESVELHLLWAIYDFLNYHGLINVGFVSKKPKRSAGDDLELRPHEAQPAERTAEIGSSDPVVVLSRNGLESKQNMEANLGGKIGNQEVDMTKGQQWSDNSNMVEFLAEVKGNGSALEFPHISGKTSSNISVETSDLCGDEESLLDIKNRIMARNRKKKQSMFGKVLPASGVKHCAEKEKANFKELRVVKDSRCEDALERMGTSITKVQKDDIDENGGIAENRNSDNQEKQKKVIIVGAGPAGLAAGRHLQKMGIEVIILEAQKRVGGRAFTDYTSFSGPVDLGASIIKGVEPEVITGRRPDPTALLCKQLGLELAVLQHEFPVFDFVTGVKVPDDIEKEVKVNFDSIIDQTAALISEHGMQISIEEGIELVLRKQSYCRKDYGFPVDDVQTESIECGVVPQKEMANREASKYLADDPLIGCIEGTCLVKQNVNLNSLPERVMEWHFANLEYACGGELNNVSLPFYWNHVDAKCGFGGPHCMIKAGFGAVMEGFRDGLDIHMEQVVTAIDYTSEGEKPSTESQVQVQTEKMDMFIADAVLLTVPLGCLKSHCIKFSPPLPDWKTAAIERLGFGLVNKVVMEFPATFWDEKVDYFGVTAEKSVYRGQCFIFYNLKRTLGLPILSAIVAGKAAIEDEQKEIELVEYALTVLRKLYGEKAVPQPTAFRVTKWGIDPFSRGAYSYVTIGASKEDYDVLSLPVQNKVFFAGDATCRDNPNSVGGAILSGIREAVRILEALHGFRDIFSESKIISTSERKLEMEKDGLVNILKNANASTQKLVDDELLKSAASMEEFLASLKSNSRRLSVAQEMLQLPCSSLRKFLGTRDGLLVLKAWMKESLSTNGMQLLRLCIHLLLMAGADLSSVRQSGIAWIVEDVVKMQPSKVIHAGANELLDQWRNVMNEGTNIVKHLKPSSNSLKKRLNQQKDLSIDVDACMPILDSLCGSNVRTMGKRSNEGQENPSTSKTNEGHRKSSDSINKMDACRRSKKFVSKSNSGDQKKDKNQKLISLTTPVKKSHISPVCEDSFKFTSEQPVQSAGLMQTGNPTTEDVSKGGETLGQAHEETTEISGLEATALAAAEAADAAVKAFQTTEAIKEKLPELPRIVSFQKFAKRENVTETNKRKPLQRETLMLYGRDLITSGSDARQCKVREWSIDFSESCCYLGGPDMLPVHDSGTNNGDGFSSAIVGMPGTSGTDTAGEKHESCFTLDKEEPLPISREIIDEPSVSSSIRGSHQRKHGICVSSLNSASTPVSSTLSIEVQKVDTKSMSDQRQLSDPDKSGEFISLNTEKWSEGFVTAVQKLDVVDGAHASGNGSDDASSMRATFKENAAQRIEASSSGHILFDPEKHGDSSLGVVQLINIQGGGKRSEDVRQAITDYVTRLLQPLYKTRRIDKETFKSMLKKATMKVMERRTKEELAMHVAEFLDTKRKLKIRSLIDKLVERHLESVGK